MLTVKKALGGAILAMGLSGYAAAHGHCGETALHEDMENLKTELKSLSFDLRGKDAAAASERVDVIISLLKNSREETPFKFTKEGLTGEALATEMAEYQSLMDETIEVFVSVDKAIDANDMGEAGSLLREVGNLRKKGHSAFKASC